MEREEGDDMFFLLVWRVGGRREYIFFSNLCPGREQKKSRVESSLSVCLSCKQVKVN